MIIIGTACLLNKVALQLSSERYYSEDSPQRQQGLERYLIKMREDLIERACIANPKIAEVLSKAPVKVLPTRRFKILGSRPLKSNPVRPTHQPLPNGFVPEQLSV